MKTITWRWRCVWNCYSWSSFDEIKNDSRPPWKYDESWLQILYFADSCPCSITNDDVSAPNELTVLKIGFELFVRWHCGGLLIGWCCRVNSYFRAITGNRDYHNSKSDNMIWLIWWLYLSLLNSSISSDKPIAVRQLSDGCYFYLINATHPFILAKSDCVDHRICPLNLILFRKNKWNWRN